MNSHESVVTVAEIARRRNIPRKFLEQILLQFKGAGLVASRRGQKGGYFLAVPASKISLADIVRLTEGSLAPIECVSESYYDECPHEATCPFREVWMDIKKYMIEKLENLTIYDMCERAEKISDKHPLEFVI